MRKRFLGLTFYDRYFVAIIFIIVAAIFVNCTDHTMSRKFGGKETITLPKGMKLVEATWKESDLWYLLEPMDANYVPKTKIFQEDSRFGVLEGKVTFIESR
jgi:hypothetical protein